MIWGRPIWATGSFNRIPHTAAESPWLDHGAHLLELARPMENEMNPGWKREAVPTVAHNGPRGQATGIRSGRDSAGAVPLGSSLESGMFSFHFQDLTPAIQVHRNAVYI